MNLYCLTQSIANDYDTYDAIVVAAESEETAKKIHPNGNWGDESWARIPEQVTAEFLGIAKDDTQEGVILASFRAG